jgi:hypothetical protein
MPRSAKDGLHARQRSRTLESVQLEAGRSAKGHELGIALAVCRLSQAAAHISRGEVFV